MCPDGEPVGDCVCPGGRIPILLVMPHTRGNERELRRHIDRAVGRALVDRDYAVALLADPTLALKSAACPLGDNADLQKIHASCVADFACQALEVFFHPTLQSTRTSMAGLEFPRFAA
jgi:hypothetical protein